MSFVPNCREVVLFQRFLSIDYVLSVCPLLEGLSSFRVSIIRHSLSLHTIVTAQHVIVGG